MQNSISKDFRVILNKLLNPSMIKCKTKKRRNKRNRKTRSRRQQKGGQGLQMYFFLLALFITLSIQLSSAASTRNIKRFNEIAEDLRNTRRIVLQTSGRNFTDVFPSKNIAIKAGIDFLDVNPVDLQRKIIENFWDKLMTHVRSKKLTDMQIIEYLANQPYQIDTAKSVLYIGDVKTGDVRFAMTPYEIFLNATSSPERLNIVDVFVNNRSLLFDETEQSVLPASMRALNKGDPLQNLEDIFFEVVKEIESNNKAFLEPFNKYYAKLIWSTFAIFCALTLYTLGYFSKQSIKGIKELINKILFQNFENLEEFSRQGFVYNPEKQLSPFRKLPQEQDNPFYVSSLFSGLSPQKQDNSSSAVTASSPSRMNSLSSLLGRSPSATEAVAVPEAVPEAAPVEAPEAAPEAAVAKKRSTTPTRQSATTPIRRSARLKEREKKP